MKNKTWGGRFKHALHPLARSFNASIGFDHILYPYDILGSQAHAKMLGIQGIIPQPEAELICKTLDEILEEIQSGEITWDEQYEDIHMLIESHLIQKIGDVGKKLHTGRSRNDQVALDLRLYTREMTTKIIASLMEVCRIFSELSQQHAADLMPGYTHLQQAQPIELGVYFDAYHQMFERDIHRFETNFTRMNFSPLGASALAGSSLPLDRAYVAEALWFHGVIENTLDAVSDRDFIIDFCNAAATTMMHLSRLAEDLIIWTTSEFNFVTLSDEFATGSSLMPNKKNPDILELIRGKSGRVFGHLLGMLTLMKGLPLAYNKDMQEDKEALFDTVKTLNACLSILPPFLKSLQFNTEHMAHCATHGFLNATALVEEQVMQGVPFREAHHRVGAMVLEAIEKGSTKLSQSRETKHLLTGMELSAEDIFNILELASQIKKNPSTYAHKLQGKNLALIFEKPSFRTRLSFNLAIESLGGKAIESVSDTRKTEDPKDSIRVLNGYCDFVMVRTHDDATLKEMAAHSTIPIINGLSALHHPCQALADLLSLKEQFGDLSQVTLAYVGDGNNVLHSLLQLGPKMGVNLHYSCPAGHLPDEVILSEAEQQFPDQIQFFEHPKDAVVDAHAVYTDVWISMGFEEKNSLENFKGFQVNEELMSYARPKAVFMHCMPMERGQEVSHSLPDAPCSIIFSQSENRLHVQKALLIFLSANNY